MLTAVVIGALIGFVLAMPPGPIAMASIRLGLEKGRRETFQMSFGTAFLDMIYCLLAVFAASAIENTITSYFHSYPILLLIFQIGVVLGLVFFGIKQFKKNQLKETDLILEKQTPDFLKKLKSRGPFLLGIALALTNIANPTFLPSLAIMSSTVHKMNLLSNSTLDNISFSLGFGIGNFLWLYVLGVIVNMNKHKLSDTSIARIRQFAGLTFIGFGGWIGYRVLVFTNWAQIFKFALAF